MRRTLFTLAALRLTLLATPHAAPLTIFANGKIVNVDESFSITDAMAVDDERIVALGDKANGYYGYLPAPRHFQLGCYETWRGTNHIEPQASVKIVDALLEMASELTMKSK